MSPALASDPAVSAKADPPKAQTPKATTARPETIEEIVARVQRRLAMETARPAPATTAARPTPPAPGARVTLVWRPSIVWPDELLDAGRDADALTDRVTLSWDDAATP